MEISDDKLAQLNVLHTDQDRADFDAVAKRYLDELATHPKSAEEIQSQADDLSHRVNLLKAKLGVNDLPDQ
nr:hypothetical protein [Kibdelosporangium sp. MJ126-NF4]